jgi:hypothetical protein
MPSSTGPVDSDQAYGSGGHTRETRREAGLAMQVPAHTESHIAINTRAACSQPSEPRPLQRINQHRPVLRHPWTRCKHL